MSDIVQSTAEQFLTFLRPIERELQGYARRLLWEPQSLQDVLQNAVLRAYGAFDRYHEDGSFRAWMFKILTNEIFTLNRKHSRRAKFEFQLEPDELAELPHLTDADSWLDQPQAWAEAIDDRISVALRVLNDSERAVLLLRGVGGFRYQEIANTLGMPLGSVMGYLSRARAKMRQGLGQVYREALP